MRALSEALDRLGNALRFNVRGAKYPSGKLKLSTAKRSVRAAKKAERTGDLKRIGEVERALRAGPLDPKQYR